jgi:hypothetical protein
MKNSRRIILRTILFPLFSLLLLSCGGSGENADKALGEISANACSAKNALRQVGDGTNCVDDKFTQPPAPVTSKVDILFVMDNSQSMHRHWQLMATQIDKLVRELPAQENLRFAVIIGSIEKNTGVLFSAPNVPKVLDGTQMSPAQISAALRATFAEAMKDKYVDWIGAGEASVYSTYYAVTRGARPIQKQGFFRPDAALNVIFMSDDADESFPYPAKQFWDLPKKCNWGHHEKMRKLYHVPRGISVDSTFTAIQHLKGDMPVLTNAFVNITREDILADNKLSAKCIFDSPGLGYFEMVKKTDGVLYSIHGQMDQGLKLNGQVLRARLGLIHDFTLSTPASSVDAATIVTKVDGAVVPHTYDATTNVVHIEQAGNPGSLVEIHHCEPQALPTWEITDFSGDTSMNSAALTWNTLGYQTIGKINYGTSADALNDTVAETGASYIHSVAVSGLVPDTTYFFQVVAADSFGTEKKSSVISLHTKPSWVVSALTGQASRNSASVSWSTAAYSTVGHVIWGISPDQLVNVTADTAALKDHTVLFNGLDANTTYYFQAISRDEFGMEKRTQVLGLKTITDWAIVGFAGSASRFSASLAWQTPEYATAGKLYYGLSANSLDKSIDSAAIGTVHNVAVSGLTAGTKYYFRAVSSDDLGSVKNSGVISLTTAADWTLGNIETDSSETTFTVAFKTAGYPTHGKVLWGTAADRLVNEIDAGTQDDHTAAATGLLADSDYYVQVSATDDLGVEKRSDVIVVHTKAIPLPKWTITEFTGASTTSAVALSWKTSEYATTGRIAYGLSPDALTGSLAECGPFTDHALNVSGLNPDTLYYFQVVAHDDRGQEQSSAVVAIRTQALPLPVWEIAAFAGTSAQNSVTVSWATAAYPTLGKVRWGISATNLNQETALDASGKFHQFTINSLNESTTYYFQAVAADDRGQLKQSAVIAVRTQDAPLPAWEITDFAGVPSVNSVALSWNTSAYATNGKIRWGSSPTDLSKETSPSAATTAHATIVSGLTGNTTYYFQAVGTDDRGQTKQSAVIAVTTLVPSSWTIVGFDGTTTSISATLIWQTPGTPTRATIKIGLTADDLTWKTAEVAEYKEVQLATVTGLAPSTDYYFQLITISADGGIVSSTVLHKVTKPARN